MDKPTHTGYVRKPPRKWEEVIVSRSGSYEESWWLLLDACRKQSCDMVVLEIGKDPNKKRLT